MHPTRNAFLQFFLRVSLILTLVSVLISCQLSPLPIESGTTSEAIKATVPTLPGTFQTELLNPVDTPHTYVEETCRYLRNKWNPLNAAPGTVVMVIVFKNISGASTGQSGEISFIEFSNLMNQLQAQGFEAINTEQLQAFMERNIEIPPRSVYLIQDGNKPAEYFDQTFRDYFLMWGWQVINGWVSEPDIDEELLAENFSLEYEGFVDHQARGVFADTRLSDETAKTVIAREVQGSLTGFANYFGKTPTAIIWPNGGFGYRPVEAARQLRFKLGFTANPRGPIMYNWVPLADATDPQRPELRPEGLVNDPLMTLPTYYPMEALASIDVVRIIGETAAEYAAVNRDAEFNYYQVVCEPELGPMPSP